MLGNVIAASTSQLTAAAISTLPADVLAKGSDTTLNTSGIVEFIVGKIVPILLAVVGVIILSRSGKGRWSEALTTGGIAVLGLIFIAGAGILFAFGESVAKLAFGG
jgi:hypothetical protein